MHYSFMHPWMGRFSTLPSITKQHVGAYRPCARRTDEKALHLWGQALKGYRHPKCKVTFLSVRRRKRKKLGSKPKKN